MPEVSCRKRQHDPAPETPNPKPKRSRNPNIVGQRLPVNRLVETLDHRSLQDLFQSVMGHFPEVASTVAQLAPRPGVSESIKLISAKAHAIRQALPYKCDAEGDYSYTRIKPQLTEFLHCISDFVLDLLPPSGSQLRDSSSVLHAITNTLHELPSFRNKEFLYTRSMAYEQLAHSWLILLQHRDEADDDAQLSSDKRVEFAKTVDELALLEKLRSHDKQSSGKFAAVVEYLAAEMEAVAELSRAQPPSIFSELITVDYSSYSVARTSH